MSYFENKNILIISPEPWGKLYVSKHNYALTLSSMGNKVWFMNPIWAASMPADKSDQAKIIVINDVYTPRGMRHIPSWLRKIIAGRICRKIASDCNTEFDVVWSFDNSRFFDLDAFGSRVFRIHHVVDFDMHYQMKLACESANLCLAVTDGILKKMICFNPNSHFIHQAYSPTPPSGKQLPRTSRKIKALYTGNLLMRYIHWDVIHRIINENPDIEFYFAGSTGTDNLNYEVKPQQLEGIEALRHFDNAVLLGQCSASDIQDFMKQVDILFHAYYFDDDPELVANPHKIPIYLGSGKVIVSYKIKVYEGEKNLLQMADTPEEYVEIFNHVKSNLDYYNSPELQKNRIDFAMRNTYTEQLNKIEKLIALSS